MGIFICGGSNLDIKASSAGQFHYGTSNPGTVWRSVGGVGRNIAHSLALLGSKVVFCSALGDDEAGRDIIEQTAAAGVDMRPVLRCRSCGTGTYIAVQDGTGELVGAVSDMRAMDLLQPEELEKWRPEIGAALCLAADTNLPGRTLFSLSELAFEYGIPLLVEPVSVEKASRLRRSDFVADWITPNADELQALWSIPAKAWKSFDDYLTGLVRPGDRAYTGEEDPPAFPLAPTVLSELLKHVEWEKAPQAGGLLVTLGSRGVLLLIKEDGSTKDGPSSPVRLTGHSGAAADLAGAASPGHAWRGLLFPTRPVKVLDPNGAGDAFAAGFIHFLYGNGGVEKESPARGGTKNPVRHVSSSEGGRRREVSAGKLHRAIACGQVCAALTLESNYTTAQDLSEEKVLKRLRSPIFISQESTDEE
jgi:sugar/nucleoside kinase (ribokinase family)